MKLGCQLTVEISEVYDSQTIEVMNTQALPNGRPTPPAPMDRNNSTPSSQGPAQSVASTNPKVAAQVASDSRNIVRRKLTGYVGFANLPNQWHRKSVRKGFNFNVMVVGESDE